MTDTTRSSGGPVDCQMMIKTEIGIEICDRNPDNVMVSADPYRSCFKAETDVQENKRVQSTNAGHGSVESKSTTRRIVRPWENSPNSQRIRSSGHLVRYVPAYYPARYYQMQSALHHLGMTAWQPMPYAYDKMGCHAMPYTHDNVGYHSMPYAYDTMGCHYSANNRSTTGCHSSPQKYDTTGCHPTTPYNYGMTGCHSSPELSPKSSDSGYRSDLNPHKKRRLSSVNVKRESDDKPNNNNNNNIDMDNKSRLLNSEAIQMLEVWYLDNAERPYPGKQAVSRLARTGNITPAQVRKWLANKRVRSLNTKGKGRTSKARVNTGTSSNRCHPYVFTGTTKQGLALPLTLPSTDSSVNVDTATAAGTATRLTTTTAKNNRISLLTKTASNETVTSNLTSSYVKVEPGLMEITPYH